MPKTNIYSSLWLQVDILIIKENNNLKTNLYQMHMDRNTLLHGDSCHPLSLKRNLPICQFNRIRRICSFDEDYNIQARELEERFQKQGYIQTWIVDAASRFSEISQTGCLTNRRKEDRQNRVICALEYSTISKHSLPLKKYLLYNSQCNLHANMPVRTCLCWGNVETFKHMYCRTPQYYLKSCYH